MRSHPLHDRFPGTKISCADTSYSLGIMIADFCFFDKRGNEVLVYFYLSFSLFALNNFCDCFSHSVYRSVCFNQKLTLTEFRVFLQVAHFKGADRFIVYRDLAR